MKHKKVRVRSWASRFCTLFLLMIGFLYISAHVSLIYPKTEQIDFLLEQRRNPRVKAFLDMIAYAEGTAGVYGYRTHYTGVLFHNFADHPRKVICAPYRDKELCSSAAGRYQFLQKTWDDLAPRIKANNFGPLQQDLAAAELLRQNNALDLIIKGDIEAAIVKVNKVWASFPGSPYGQRTCSLSQLKNVYYDRLRIQGGL